VAFKFPRRTTPDTLSSGNGGRPFPVTLSRPHRHLLLGLIRPAGSLPEGAASGFWGLIGVTVVIVPKTASCDDQQLGGQRLWRDWVPLRTDGNTATTRERNQRSGGNFDDSEECATTFGFRVVMQWHSFWRPSVVRVGKPGLRCVPSKAATRPQKHARRSPVIPRWGVWAFWPTRCTLHHAPRLFRPFVRCFVHVKPSSGCLPRTPELK